MVIANLVSGNKLTVDNGIVNVIEEMGVWNDLDFEFRKYFTMN